ncbi:uncharacterized protein LOC131329475 [Rhododendron vialii]|uniref:uncharacterized protein LOC131329475 n=1 Tax=Rhododendron vialii TaxID=182163 RepID=UPI00266037EF|nr:uncharacterized protein LOC131329475 [Rhododendron vialii]
MKKLIKSGHLRPLTPTPLPQNPPSSHNPNTFCAYHQMRGHLTNSCYRLRHVIQDLIDDGTVQTPPPSKPNVIFNSMPKHNFNLHISYLDQSDVDEQYWSYYQEGESVPDVHCPLKAMLPLVNSISNAVDDRIREFNPSLNIVSVDQPCPIVTAPGDDCSIMVLQGAPPDDLWEVDEIVDVGRASPLANLWDVDTVTNVTVGDEVWTVNSALVDGGLWDVSFVTNPGIPFEDAAAQDPAFCEGLAMEDLATDLALGQDASPTVALVNKGKHKLREVLADLWDSVADIKGVPSLWDVANVPSDITPEAMIALILPLISKHSITFTERDLPVDGVAHNRLLHITVKCIGHWVPIELINNDSAINVCPLRVAYRLGLTKKDLTSSNLAIKAYDSTRRVVQGTLMLELDAKGFKMDV